MSWVGRCCTAVLYLVLETLGGVFLGVGQEAVVDVKPQAVLEVARQAQDHVPRAAPDLDRATPASRPRHTVAVEDMPQFVFFLIETESQYTRTLSHAMRERRYICTSKYSI